MQIFNSILTKNIAMGFWSLLFIGMFIFYIRTESTATTAAIMTNSNDSKNTTISSGATINSTTTPNTIAHNTASISSTTPNTISSTINISMPFTSINDAPDTTVSTPFTTTTSIPTVTSKSTTPVSSIVTSNSNISENLMSPGLTQEAIIGIAVAASILILLGSIVIFLICCWIRKKKKIDSPIHNSVTDKTEVIVPLVERALNPVKLENLLKYVQDRQNDSKLYKSEFESLPKSNISSVSESQTDENKKRNRFLDILPYNHSRVKLHENPNYINANYIDGFHSEKAYIATQGPKSETAVDFWKMVWQENSTKIIMVANLMEENQPKCFQYYPAKQTEGQVLTSLNFGNFDIQLIDEVCYGQYIVRKLDLKKGDEIRTVSQYHFTKWPDRGTPDSPTDFLKFYYACLAQEDGPKNPIIIHCSAGVGRTGTLLSVDWLLHQANVEGYVDFCKCIENLRSKRMFMVQTIEQFIFIHHVLLEALIAGKVAFTPIEFPSYVAEMKNEQTLVQIIKQFQVLEMLKRHFYEGSFSLSTDPENSRFNRDQDVLPVDDFIPFIHSIGSNSMKHYINAVFVTGSKGMQSFIATQLPLEETKSMFWHMIYEHKCCAIVTLQDLPSSSDQYWPEDGSSIKCHRLKITNTGEIASEDIVICDLEITVFEPKDAHTKIDENKEDTNLRATNYLEMDTLKKENSRTNLLDVDSKRFSKLSAKESLTSRKGSSKLRVPIDESKRHSQRLSSISTVSNDYNGDYYNVVDLATNLHVRHIRVLNWPDSDPLPQKSTMINLMQELDKCQERMPQSYPVLQCINGQQRSGLVACLMNIYDHLMLENEIDIFNSVKSARKTKPQFIQNIEEYNFLYEMALELTKQHIN